MTLGCSPKPGATQAVVSSPLSGKLVLTNVSKDQSVRPLGGQ